MIFNTKSTLSALFFNLRWFDFLTPWRIIIDTDEETITIRKRNFILIGVDEKVYSFRYIRNVKIDEHVIGADIEIKVVGGKASAYSLSKKDCKQIKRILIDYNQTRKGKGIIIG